VLNRWIYSSSRLNGSSKLAFTVLFGGSLGKNIAKLLWAGKYVNVRSALQEQEMTLSHWPTKIVGGGDES